MAEEKPVSARLMSIEFIIQGILLIFAMGVGWGIVQASLAGTDREVSSIKDDLKKTEQVIQRVETVMTRVETKQIAQEKQIDSIDKRVDKILDIIERSYRERSYRND